MKVVAFSRDLDPSTVVFRRGLITAGCISLLWTVGCGAPSSDKVPGQESRAAIAVSNQNAISKNSNQETRSPGFPPDASQAADTGRPSQESRPAGNVDENNQPQTTPNLPESIAKDLASPDARDRFRALDHWEAKDSKAPLDPVFEAMEDEDEAVRAKATAIVEQRWAPEHDREKS